MAIFSRDHWPEWAAGLVFIASSAAMVATVFGGVPVPLLHQLHELHRFKFFDLRVYRRAAQIVREGRPLYTTKLRYGLGFTYPPFAALLFLLLRTLTIRGDEIAVTLANLALTAVVAHAAIRLADRGASTRTTARTTAPTTARTTARTSGRTTAPTTARTTANSRGTRRRMCRRNAAAWLAAALAIWSEPITTTIGYGQIDLLIAALVVVDLAYGRRSRFGGLGVGVAAALKLTPLIFIAYLALTRRGGMAARASGAFALSVALSFATLPRDAWKYWAQRDFMKVSRITGAHRFAGSSAANQSLRGALLRLFPNLHQITIAWLALSLVVGTVGLLLAVRASRRSDEAWGFALTAATGLLISPVSWTHHWAIAVAATIALAGSARSPGVGALGGLTAAVTWVGGSAIWTVIALGPGARLTPRELLLGDLYVLLGLGALFTATALEAWLAVRERATRPVMSIELAAAVSADPSP